MGTAAGDIAITRPDGLLASYAVPGQPERLVALKRRNFTELLSEELRRMDPDQVYEHTVKSLLDGEPKKTTSGRAAKKGTAKKGTAKGAERARTAAKKTTTTAGSR
jgi:glucose-6-phosphate dehydrogenase assembly protein OpcA